MEQIYNKNTKEIFLKYRQILEHEKELRSSISYETCLVPAERQLLDSPSDVFNMVWRIFEVAKSEFIPKNYNAHYGLNQADFVYESISAHSNLVSAIISPALYYCYGTEFGESSSRWARTIDGFTYRDIVEAARLHDLAENEISSIPGNQNYEEHIKEFMEMDYFRRYLETYPDNDSATRYSVQRLLDDMYKQSSSTGRLLHLADRTATIISTLCLDELNRYPMIRADNPDLTENEKAAMAMCDYSYENSYRASEVRTIDFFELSKKVKQDETFFFTALIVMATLMVNSTWYHWREKRYIV